jgi:HEAT repeat protein
MSPDLARFLAALDHPDPREDSHDVSGLVGVSAVERTRAIEALMERVRTLGDTRAVMALSRIEATEALPLLRSLSLGQGPLGAAARRALVRLGVEDESTVAGLVGDSARGTFGERFAAIAALSGVDGDDALHALIEALEDPDGLVRYQAFDALVERLGVLPLVRTADGSRPNFAAPLKVMCLLLADESPSLRALGLVRLKAAIAGLVAGVSPEALGLVHVGDPEDRVGRAVGRAIRTPAAEFPVQEVLAASPHDRESAEAFWALALQRSDPRAADALGAVGATWTLPALHEVLARGGASPFLEAVRRAILRLSGAP